MNIFSKIIYIPEAQKKFGHHGNKRQQMNTESTFKKVIRLNLKNYQ